MTAYAAGSLVHAEAARRNIVAGAIGSVLEWYDFAIYGYLAPILGTLFFPASDPVASLLAAFGVFAIGSSACPRPPARAGPWCPSRSDQSCRSQGYRSPCGILKRRVTTCVR